MKRLMIVLASAFLLAFVGCKKEDSGQGYLRITVVNEDGVPIQNCNVSLTVPEPTATPFYGKTDENGYIEFEFGLHVFYDAKVWKGVWEGCDFVEIKPGETFYKNIVIYPPNSSFNGCI